MSKPSNVGMIAWMPPLPLAIGGAKDPDALVRHWFFATYNARLVQRHRLRAIAARLRQAEDGR